MSRSCSPPSFSAHPPPLPSDSSPPGYQKSYFMLYLAHSTFLLTLPSHLLFLRIFSSLSKPIGPAFEQLRRVFHHQLVGRDYDPEESGWPWRRTLSFVAGMTALITLPSGLWYASVPLTS